jgi:glycosyltransferase involved in cell wall biosynthesis
MTRPSFNKPRASLIIPCRNEVRHIEGCLRNVLAFEPPPGGFEVLVVDGMSEDGTRDIVEQWVNRDPRIRLLDNPERITPCALNRGIRAARGEVIVRIDVHTEYAPDYLCRCLEVLEETGAENVGGPWVAHGESYLQRAVAAAFQSLFAVGGARGHKASYEGLVDTVYLGCWPRRVLEQIGLFDEELVRNQDDEFNFRLIRAGGRVWQSPRIRSWYRPRSTLGTLFRQYFQYGYWKVRVMQKHRRPASLRHLVPGGFVLVVLLLFLAAPFLVSARVGLAVVLGLYLVGVVFASCAAAARAGWELLPVLPAVIACYHVGYGLGFLMGVWDFMLLRRSSGRFVALTRK